MAIAKYQNTELGLLPEDWDVVSLDKLGNIESGGTPSTIVPKYWDGSIAWCTPTDITKTSGKYISSTDRSITTEGLQNSAATVMPQGSILLCSRATIGELKICSVPMATNQGFKNIFPTKCNADFLYYLLQTKKNKMIDLAIGSTFLEISKSNLCKIPLQFPPLPEQAAIAATLSDVDDLISSLEKLIEKKKAVRQGTMHDLLSGKRRLEGFSGEWDMIRVGNVCTFCKNNTLKRDRLSYTEGSVKNVHYGDVLIKYDYIIDFAKAELPRVRPDFMNKNIGDFLQNGDIIIADAAEDLTVGKACEVTNVNHAEAVAGMDTFLIRLPADLFVHKYLGYYMNIEEYHQQLTRYVQGTKICHLPRNAVLDSCVARPSLEEQAAIISLIDDMSLEIESLFIKLDKYRAIKTGMMNELLTGRIRLIGDDETARDA